MNREVLHCRGKSMIRNDTILLNIHSMDPEEPRDVQSSEEGGFKSPEFAVLERFAFSHAIATSGNACL